ncbi:MAG: leucine-rich repeat domain-containing protein [Candidatus Limisoma sp.]
MGNQTYPVFNGCKQLTNVTIGDNVQSIPSCAFYGCTGVSEVTIPNSVRTIGENAFACNNSLVLKVKWGEPADPWYTFAEQPVTETIMQSGSLLVPIGTEAIYRQTAPWMYFANINEYAYSGVDEIAPDDVTVRVVDGKIEVNGASDSINIELYGINGTLIYCGSADNLPTPMPGLYIVRAGKTVKKVAISR